MSHIGKILQDNHLIPPGFLTELRRWGKYDSSVAPQEGLAVPPTPQKIVREIREVLEGEDQITTRETQLDVLKEFYEGARPGQLHLVDGDTKETVEVYFQETRMGSILIPWSSEGLEEILTNGETCLEYDGKTRYFTTVQELFINDQKSFMELSGGDDVG